MLSLLAQAGVAATLGWWGQVAIVVAGIVAIVLIAARAAGVDIPHWFVQILWVILAVAVGVVAIKFIVSLL